MHSDPEIIEDATDGEGEEGLAKIAKLKSKLNTCEAEKSEYLLGWQRERADFANWKKEAAERKAAEQKYLVARVLEDLMPVLDSMDKAKQWSPDLGFIESQMESVLATYGLSRYGKVGDMFDPKIYESVESIATSDENKDNSVLEIVSPGYKLEDKIIRAAKVKVATYRK